MGGPEPQTTIVHLLRHGEVHNPGGVLYGRLPGYELSELGRRMAARIAEVLAGHEVAAVISSPLERARQTAAPIAAAAGTEIEVDARLIEADSRFEGLTVGVGDGSLRHPRHWPLLRNPFRPSWGEPYTEQAARVGAVVHAARRAAAGREAVCVSHQLPIWTFRRHVESRRLWHDPRNRQCALASLTSFCFFGDTIRAVVYREPAAELVPGGTDDEFTAGA